MTTPRALPFQIESIKTAISGSDPDEETLSGLQAAIKSLAWIDKHAELIRAMVDLVKDDPQALETIREYIRLREEHPAVMEMIREFPGSVVHVNGGA